MKNDDSKQKLALGAVWTKVTGPQYRYFMVFKDEDTPLEGAVNMKQFMEILKML